MLQRKLDTLSDVFSTGNRQIVDKVCQDLKAKAKYIVEERHEMIKQ